MSLNFLQKEKDIVKLLMISYERTVTGHCKETLPFYVVKFLGHGLFIKYSHSLMDTFL